MIDSLMRRERKRVIYRIGSFNMYKFQAYRSDKEISKDLNKIAEIIRTEQFDIIALQEIFSKTAMNMLLSRLGRNWNGSWESPQSTSIQAAEGYALILSILVYTFFSRMFDLMLPPVAKHSIVVA